MKSLQTLFTALAVCILVSGCAKKLKQDNLPELSGSVTGSVAYKERIALPPEAKIIVSLEDVSRADKGSAFIAQQILRPTTQVPVQFVLRYIPSAIDRTHRYAVRASILDERDELLWSSTESYPVLFNEPARPIAVMVQRASNPNPVAAPTTTAAIPFRCDDIKFIARFGKESVQIMLAARTVILPQVISGSGARYSDGSTTFWNKGSEAVFETNGVSYQGCQTEKLPGK